MIIDSDFDDKIFKYSESDIYEYKETILDRYFDKYLQTICGFLNSGGGNLIFGITNKLCMKGLKCNNDVIDKFILRIDSIIHNKMIIGYNDQINEYINLNKSNINVKQIVNKSNNKFLIITILPMKNIKYQLSNGKMYHRLGASNYVQKTEKMFKQCDYDIACKNIQQKAEKDNKHNIELFNKTLDEKKKLIDEKNKNIELLNKNIETTNLLYKQYIENMFANQSKLNQLSNNQDIQFDYYKLINNIFPCIKFN